MAHSGLEHYQEPPQTHYLSEVENYVTFIPTNPSQSNLRTPKFSSDTRQYCGLSKSRAVATLGGVLGGEIGKRNKKVDDGTRSPTGAVKSVTILQTIPTPQLARSLQTSVSSGPTPTITLGPTETYSKISSPSGTLFRDCPASNGTIVTTANIPPQRFVKTCDWIYKPTDGNIFDTYTSTLKGCISLCAAYNTINATEPLGICTDVAWRTGSGECFGNVGGRVGVGAVATGGSSRNIPADSAFFSFRILRYCLKGWSFIAESQCYSRAYASILQSSTRFFESRNLHLPLC